MASPALRSLANNFGKVCQLLKQQRSSTLSAKVTQEWFKDATVRTMASAARKMVVSPSKFSWTRFKNDLHFYVMLGAVPLGSVIFYANFFIGQAELAEIPPGYEPKHWEYHKHPIHRWFAKYVYDDPVKSYEMDVCKFVHTFEKARQRARTERVKEMMQEHDDFRAWYFIPAVEPGAFEKTAENHKKFMEKQMGSF